MVLNKSFINKTMNIDTLPSNAFCGLSKDLKVRFVKSLHSKQTSGSN
jgi:hypothetical protein